MQQLKPQILIFLLLYIVPPESYAQNNSETFFIAHKKSSPDYFTIFVNAEKSRESIEVYNGNFPKQSLVYSEKLTRSDLTTKHKQFLLSGRRSAIYKKGDQFFAEFTGFEEEGYIIKLTPCTKEKAYQDIAMNCNYKIKQVSMLRFSLDSSLGHGNYSADFNSFEDENITFDMLNMPFNNFKNSFDIKTKKFFQDVILIEKPRLEKLKNLFNSIDKINYTTAKEFLSKTNIHTNIDKEIIYSIADKQPAMFIEILEKESNAIIKKNEIINIFQEYGAKKEKYQSLYISLSKTETKAETRQVLLKNLKKGKRHANFLKTVAVTGGIIALISIPTAFLVIINL